ncbi:MAG: SUMF1/EgtB/PvdO family nonheme iron enzyme [Nitrospirae bacterium]|nr:SUMF1/EgtB/PvdO family nonheme iron enzyme [Nitrospirota bacterium]
MTCSKCGKNIQNPKKFCPYCRNPLGEPVPPPPPSQRKTITWVIIGVVIIILFVVSLAMIGRKPVPPHDQASVATSTPATPEPTITSTPESTPAIIAKTLVESYTGMEFVLVKQGCFKMGDTFGDAGKEYEKPVRKVCITKDFYMGKYEVTQGQWMKVMGKNPSSFLSGDNYPVEQVSWNDTQQFISKLNARGEGKFRLPTEAEWEYACSWKEGGEKARFGTGEDTISPSTANFDASLDYKKPYSDVGEYRKKTTPVVSFKPNGLGLYDMSGNVWEWVADAYDKDTYKKLGENDPIYIGDSGSNRVIRGGSWNNNPNNLRCSNRNNNAPTDRNNNVGFRIVHGLPAEHVLSMDKTAVLTIRPDDCPARPFRPLKGRQKPPGHTGMVG